MPPPLEQVLMSRCDLRYREAHVIVLDARSSMGMSPRGPWNQQLLEECLEIIRNKKNSLPIPKNSQRSAISNNSFRCGGGVASNNSKKTKRQLRPINRATIRKAKRSQELRANPSMEDLGEMLQAEETQPKKFRREKRDKQQQQQPMMDDHNLRQLKREQEPLWPGSEHSANLMLSLHGVSPLPPHCTTQDASERSNTLLLWDADEDDCCDDDVSFAIEEGVILEVPYSFSVHNSSSKTNNNNSFLNSSSKTNNSSFSKQQQPRNPKSKTSLYAPFWTTRRLTGEDDDGFVDTSGSSDDMSDSSDPTFWQQQDSHTILESQQQQVSQKYSETAKESSSKACNFRPTAVQPSSYKDSKNATKSINISTHSVRSTAQRFEKKAGGRAFNRRGSTGQYYLSESDDDDDEVCIKVVGNANSLRPIGQHFENKKVRAFNRRGSTGQFLVSQPNETTTTQSDDEDTNADKSDMSAHVRGQHQSQPSATTNIKKSRRSGRRSSTGGQQNWSQPLGSKTSHGVHPDEVNNNNNNNTIEQSSIHTSYSLRPIGQHLWKPDNDTQKAKSGRRFNRRGSTGQYYLSESDDAQSDDDNTPTKKDAYSLRPVGRHWWEAGQHDDNNNNKPSHMYNRRGSTCF